MSLPHRYLVSVNLIQLLPCTQIPTILFRTDTWPQRPCPASLQGVIHKDYIIVGCSTACTLLPCLVASSSSLLGWASVVGLGSFLPLCFCCTSLSPLQPSAITLALAFGMPITFVLASRSCRNQKSILCFFPLYHTENLLPQK